MAIEFERPPSLEVYEVPAESEIELYRIVRSSDKESSALFESFISNFASGKPPRRIEARSACVHMGLSMYERPSQAEQTARLFPVIGGCVARLRLQPGNGFNLARTGQTGHWTVWGRPDQLVAAVADIYSW